MSNRLGLRKVDWIQEAEGRSQEGRSPKKAGKDRSGHRGIGFSCPSWMEWTINWLNGLVRGCNE